MNINETVFCPGKLYAGVCGQDTPPFFYIVSVCVGYRILYWFTSGYLYILNDSRKTDPLSL